MSVESKIVCDSCQQESAGFATPTKAHHVRHALRMAGWKVGQRGGRDYCWLCVEEREREQC